jgi:hypothetical protein
MRTWLLSCCIGLVTFGLAGAAEKEAAPERIAPAFRAERHFDSGAAYLRQLPEGTQVEVARADGSGFVLTLEEGVFRTSLPEAQIEDEGRVLVTPSGYRLFYDDRYRGGLVVEAPTSASARFTWINRHGMVTESDGGFWQSNYDPFPLRLPHGTRVEGLDQMQRWEALTLAGERFRLDLPEARWERLPTIPSPPLIPDLRTFYVSGNGDDWRKPAREDHTVFAWAWLPIGLTPERIVQDVSEGHRRQDLDLYFNGLDRVQPPHELAGVILGRRLALGGGDQLTLALPGEDPLTVFLLPGPLEPDFYELRPAKGDFAPELRRR